MDKCFTLAPGKTELSQFHLFLLNLKYVWLQVREKYN